MDSAGDSAERCLKRHVARAFLASIYSPDHLFRVLFFIGAYSSWYFVRRCCLRLKVYNQSRTLFEMVDRLLFPFGVLNGEFVLWLTTYFVGTEKRDPVQYLHSQSATWNIL
jgi:hypothetical protein